MLLVVFLKTSPGLSNYTPPEPNSFVAFTMLIQIVIGFFATAGAAGADFGMNSRNARDVRLGGLTGIALAAVYAGCLPLLSVAGGREMWSDWFARAGIGTPGRPALVFDSFVVALEAAKAGAGVVLASRPLADAILAEGRLRPLSDIELAGERGHFVTCPAGRALAPHEQAVLDWILDEARPRA